MFVRRPRKCHWWLPPLGMVIFTAHVLLHLRDGIWVGIHFINCKNTPHLRPSVWAGCCMCCWNRCGRHRILSQPVMVGHWCPRLNWRWFNVIAVNGWKSNAAPPLNVRRAMRPKMAFWQIDSCAMPPIKNATHFKHTLGWCYHELVINLFSFAIFSRIHVFVCACIWLCTLHICFIRCHMPAKSTPAIRKRICHISNNGIVFAGCADDGAMLWIPDKIIMIPGLDAAASTRPDACKRAWVETNGDRQATSCFCGGAY